MAQNEPQRKETPPGPSPNSPSLLFEYQCRSGKFIILANRIESNPNFFARIGMLYPPLSYLQDGCPSCRQKNSVKALKAVHSVSNDS